MLSQKLLIFCHLLNDKYTVITMTGINSTFSECDVRFSYCVLITYTIHVKCYIEIILINGLLSVIDADLLQNKLWQSDTDLR